MFEDIKQSDTAPVAWRYLVHGEWFVTNIRGAAEFRQSEGCVVEPLYTTLAQSDAERRPDDNFERHLQARLSKLEHEIDTAGLATRNPAPNAAPSSYSNTKTVTIGGPALTQSDAEPVAWRVERMQAALGKISQICRDSVADVPPPRPDASAGLIAVAEAELNQIRDCMIEDREPYEGSLGFAEDIERVAAMLRARATDRSGK